MCHVDRLYVSRRSKLFNFCLSGCFSKPQSVVLRSAPTVVSEDATPISSRLRQRKGLRAVLGGLSLARWFHLSSMRTSASLRTGEPATAAVCWLPAPSLADRWNCSSPDQDPLDPLVLGRLPDDH